MSVDRLQSQQKAGAVSFQPAGYEGEPGEQDFTIILTVIYFSFQISQKTPSSCADTSPNESEGLFLKGTPWREVNKKRVDRLKRETRLVYIGAGV